MRKCKIEPFGLFALAMVQLISKYPVMHCTVAHIFWTDFNDLQPVYN